jgi:Galactosyltransferase
MQNQEYIMLIMNCKKYLKKAKFQKMTWLSKIPSYLKYYHVIGDETIDEEYKFDDEHQILWVKVADDYNSLPKKVIAAYNAVQETFNFRYIYKTDDDQILVNDKFLDIIKGLISRTPKIHYGGYIVDVKDNYLSQYHKIHPELPSYLPILQTQYCSGRFYFLSNQAINNILSKRKNIENEFLEDYAIGYNLDPYFKLNMLNLSTNNFFTDIELSDFPKLVEEGKI